MPQLKQLRKYDKKYNKKLEVYFLEKDLEETNKLQEFTENYYAKDAHHIYNYLRKNDFVQSLNMTVGTFNVGKTIEFPPVLKTFVPPEDFLTEEDTYELDRIFGDFYNRLLEKGFTPDLVKEKEKEIADEFVAFLISEIKNPIQNQVTSLRRWINKEEGNENIKKAYRTFKAVYNYMLYLAHSGIILEDVINNKDGKEVQSIFEEAIGDGAVTSFKKLLKPLQEFYTLTKAIYTITHAKELDDIEGWAEVADAHDLTAMYDVLEG